MLTTPDQKKAEYASNPTADSIPQTQQATAGSSDLGFDIIPLVSDIKLSRKNLQLPCHILPVSRNRDFYGRTDVMRSLERIFFQSSPISSEEDLVTNADEIKTSALCGPGGMGKTQIAAEFVHSNKGRFDAIFWIYADQSTKVAEGFGRIASELGLVAEDSVDARDPVVVRDLVKGWLANPLKSLDPSNDTITNHATWLIVFDNTDDVEILAEYWPLDGPGCVLFTSRDPLAFRAANMANNIVELGPFSSDEASKFLMKITKKTGDSKGVAERLGGLPLAITQMAGVIIRRDLTFAEFLKSYDEEGSHEELFNLHVGQRARGPGYGHTLASVWALESLRHGPALLDVLAFLDPDGTQERILTTSPNFAVLDDFPKSAIAYQRARTELLQSSLVARDKTAEKLVVHRLIQDAARTKMDSVRFRAVFSSALMLVSSVWPYAPSGWRHKVKRWRVCEDFSPHVIRLKQFASQIVISYQTIHVDLELAQLLNDAGW